MTNVNDYSRNFKKTNQMILSSNDISTAFCELLQDTLFSILGSSLPICKQKEKTISIVYTIVYKYYEKT